MKKVNNLNIGKIFIKSYMDKKSLKEILITQLPRKYGENRI
jgi:hypothetical protein